MENKKKRQSNYELMRIVSMFLIVVWHILVHGNLLNNTSGINHTIMQLIICFIIVHVNSFILLTGYFQYNKKFSIKRFLATLNSAWFYKIIFLVLFTILGLVVINKFDFIYTLLPFDSGYWFINTYLILLLLSPFLNKIIENISKIDFQRLLAISVILFSILPFITNQTVVTNNGSNIINFILLYFIGAYLHKYEVIKNILSIAKKRKLQLIMLAIIVGSASLNFVCWKFGDVFAYSNNNLIIYLCDIFKGTAMSYANPFVIIQSVCYFILFGTFEFKNKIINYISPLMFGIYLIHDNRNVRGHVYEWLGISNMETTNLINLLLAIVLCATLIFVACGIIEFLRQKLFEFIKKQPPSKSISEKLYNIFYKIPLIKNNN